MVTIIFFMTEFFTVNEHQWLPCILRMCVGDLKGDHQEWLGSTTTNRLGVAAFDFATVSGCDQLVGGPTHARCATLDLQLICS